MRTQWSFRVEQLRVLQELDRLVVAGHVTCTLAAINLSLHTFLLLFAQAGDVATVDPASVRALELRQKPDVLVVGMNVHFAKNALLLFSLERVIHGDGLVGRRPGVGGDEGAVVGGCDGATAEEQYLVGDIT